VRKFAVVILGAALVVLVLWGWYQTPAGKTAIQTESPAKPTSVLSHSNGPQDTDSAAGRAKALCSSAFAKAFDARARHVGLQQDAASQLAYAMAVPFDVEPDIDRMQPAELERIAMGRQREANRALLRAAELAPEQPGILFLAAAQCTGQAACRGVQQALLAAEPDNMAAWLLEMNWAKARDDSEGARIAIKCAAQASRYDMHVETRLQMLVDAYGGSPPPAACTGESAMAAFRRETGMAHGDSFFDHALVRAAGTRASVSYGAIREQCLPARPAVVDQVGQKACRTILERLAKGETFLERGVGLALLLQLLGDSPDATPWR